MRDEEAAVLAALRADGVTAACLLDALEEDLAVWTGGITCTAVSSASAAMHVAYAASGLGRGDQALISPLASMAAFATAVLSGAQVVFADVDDETGNLDPAAVADRLTSRTHVVTTTDFAGHPSDYDALRAVTGDVIVVAESAEGIAGTYRGVPVGAIADLTALSFTAFTGSGGALAVADESMLDAARRFRDGGRAIGSTVMSVGLDYRLPTLLAALARVQLRGLSRLRSRRTDLAERYSKLLDDVADLRPPVRLDGVEPAWHRYPIRVLDGRRDAVLESMRSAGFAVTRGDVPLYWQPAVADLGYRRGLCPMAERLYAQQLYLPLTADLTDADQDAVVDALRAACS
jgi:dTDP-4-amino-4,6-dideoxygalactose transaminase